MCLSVKNLVYIYKECGSGLIYSFLPPPPDLTAQVREVWGEDTCSLQRTDSSNVL